MDKPSSIFIDDVTESSISISWDAPFLGGGATSITGYYVTISSDEIDSLYVQETTANITGLISNKNYSVSVVAVGSDERNGTAVETTVRTGMLIFKFLYSAM